MMIAGKNPIVARAADDEKARLQVQRGDFENDASVRVS